MQYICRQPAADWLQEQLHLHGQLQLLWAGAGHPVRGHHPEQEQGGLVRPLGDIQVLHPAPG